MGRCCGAAALYGGERLPAAAPILPPPAGRRRGMAAGRSYRGCGADAATGGGSQRAAARYGGERPPDRHPNTTPASSQRLDCGAADSPPRAAAAARGAGRRRGCGCGANLLALCAVRRRLRRLAAPRPPPDTVGRSQQPAERGGCVDAAAGRLCSTVASGPPTADPTPPQPAARDWTTGKQSLQIRRSGPLAATCGTGRAERRRATGRSPVGCSGPLPPDTQASLL